MEDVFFVLLRDLSGRKLWTGRLFHDFGCPFRDEPRITAKWPPGPKFWIVKKFLFLWELTSRKISRISHSQKNAGKSDILTILHFTHSKAIDVVYVVQNPWRGFERSAVRAWPRHLVQDDLVEDKDRKQGSVTHCTTYMTECRSQYRAMAYFLISRFT